MAAVNTPSRPTILVVDDNADTKRVIAKLIRARGFAVATAGSVQEALEQAAEHRIGFVVSDIGLPDGTGYELMAELRDRYGLRGVAITGYGMEADVATAIGAGFELHFTKPIHIDALERIVAVAKEALADAGG